MNTHTCGNILRHESFIKQMHRDIQSYNQKYIYQITITPIGNNIQFEDYYYDLIVAFNTMKSVKKVYLFKETRQTNHFHAIVTTTREHKFKRYPYKEKFTIHLDHRCETLYESLKYVSKDYFKHNEYIYFNKYLNKYIFYKCQFTFKRANQKIKII